MTADSKLQLILTTYNNWESEQAKESYIESLEEMIELMNEQARQGNPQYSDAIYDTCIDFLRELKPDSYLLHQVWSEDDNTVELNEDTDRFLYQYPMLSIQTVKHPSDKAVERFRSQLPVGDVQVINALKLNGHGVRVVIKDGHLISSTSRGRSTAGKDLTRQAKLILGEYFPNLEHYGLVELRGEVVLPFSNLEEARKFNPSIKSAFTGVASMIRSSATPEETRLLDIVFFDILCDNLEFSTLSEKYEFLDSVGLNIPFYTISTVNRRSIVEDFDRIIMDMDIRSTDYPYYTDGIVVSIDDLELFHEFGAEDQYRLGNLALKMGRWAQDSYSGVISHIEWKRGKSKLTPVAVLEEPVLTATGASVQNIPLYAPLYILLIQAYPGNVINFRFGGEAGVIPITSDGRLVTDLSFEDYENIAIVD